MSVQQEFNFTSSSSLLTDWSSIISTESTAFSTHEYTPNGYESLIKTRIIDYISILNDNLDTLDKHSNTKEEEPKLIIKTKILSTRNMLEAIKILWNEETK